MGHDTSGPTTDDAMTLSEEQLQRRHRAAEAGRARLRKYVVTENVHPDRAGAARGGPDRARAHHRRQPSATRLDGPAITEEEHEVTLHEERPVVEKEPCRWSASASTPRPSPSRRQVNEEVRKEQIDTDGDGIADRR